MSYPRHTVLTMSIDTSNTIAGQPILSLIEGLRSIEFDLLADDAVLVWPKVSRDGVAVWRAAIEQVTGQPFATDGAAPVQQLQRSAFLTIVKELMTTLQPRDVVS